MRIVNDFFIKFKKKLHFANLLAEQAQNFVLQGFFRRLAEMDSDKVGGLVDGLADAGRRVVFGNGLLNRCVVHQVPPCKQMNDSWNQRLVLNRRFYRACVSGCGK